MRIEEFQELRYGMFIHYGLYSQLGRGEWVMNREHIPANEYRRVADSFRGDKFNADAIAQLAVDAGMRYVVFSTMHHDGFRMYDSQLTDFCSTKTAAKRDFTGEMIAACRKHGLKVGLYHSLNQWSDTPSSADALEDPAAHDLFIKNTFARINELVAKYRPFDMLWYDGKWPFTAKEWQAERMNEMVRQENPGCLVNGRNGLAGDYATPEQHATVPSPWRPWETCMTLNNSWGFHHGDEESKSPQDLIRILARCAAGKGNLLLNVGPHGDGSLPQPSIDRLKTLGAWLWRNGDAIYGTEKFTYDLREHMTPELIAARADGCHRSDWNYHGPLTSKKDSLYQFIMRWLGGTITIGGVHCKVRQILEVSTNREIKFKQEGPRLTLYGLPDQPIDPICTVFRMRCSGKPAFYNCAGSRIPNAPHWNYNPVE